MQKPLLEKNIEETLKNLFSQAGFHLQKIKDYTNQIDKETQKALKLSNARDFYKKKDEIINNVTKEVINLKSIMVKIEDIDTPSISLSDMKAKTQIRLKENFDSEIDRYGNVMKQISEMKLNEKIKQSRLSLNKSNISESQISNDDDALQNEERIKQMQILNFEEDLVKERDEDIKEIAKLVKNLKGMVVDINTHVVEQGKQIEKIEENIDITKENVVKAEKEIEKANVISKNNFRTKCKISILIIIALVVVGLILGLSIGLKK